MRRNFEELQSFLHLNFPVLKEADSIRGELYPPPAYAQTLASVGSIVQLGGMAITLGGSFIFETLGLPEPFFVPVMRRNTIPTILGLFIFSSVCGQFLETGAFEVWIDGDLVFSRLEDKGKFPSGAVLINELEKRGLRSTKHHKIGK